MVFIVIAILIVVIVFAATGTSSEAKTQGSTPKPPVPPIRPPALPTQQAYRPVPPPQVPQQAARPTTPAVHSAPRTSAPPLPVYQPGVIYPDLDFYSVGTDATNYPPDWSARKSAVKKRDGSRCQVTGCLSLCALDVHHITPIHEGGSHRLDNLVCLCLVHHWLLPFHSLVAERADSDRFSMRRAHSRWHPTRPERINVRATFERYVTASISDCERIRDHFGFRCTTCHSDGIHFAQINEQFVCACLGCRTGWALPRLLPEEIGPILLSYFQATQNIGSFQFDLSLLGEHPRRPVDLCYACADEARIALLLPKTGRNGPFKGCSNYQVNGCQNTDQRQHRRYARFSTNQRA